MNNDYITVKEAARILGVSRKTIWRMMDEEEINYIDRESETGGRPTRLVSKADIQDRLNNEKDSEIQEAPAQLPVLADSPVKDIKQVLENWLDERDRKRDIRVLARERKERRKSLIYRLIAWIIILGALACFIRYYGVMTLDTLKKFERDISTTLTRSKKAGIEAGMAQEKRLKAEIARTGQRIEALKNAQKDLKQKLTEVTRTGKDESQAQIEALEKKLAAQEEAYNRLSIALYALIEALAAPPPATPAPLPTPAITREAVPPPAMEKKPPVPTPTPETTGGGFLGIF